MHKKPSLITRFLMLAALLLPVIGHSAEDLVPAEQAFTHQVSVDGDEIVIDWTVLPGYYLYKEKIKLSLEDTQASAIMPLLPRGKDHSDEFFGEQEIYESDFQARLPFAGAKSSEATLVIRSQGCSTEFGICFPPKTQRYPVTLAASTASTAVLSDLPFGGTTTSTSLEPDAAFAPIVTEVSADGLEIGWQIAPDHYLYKTEIQANFAGTDVRIVDVKLPEGTPKSDEYFGDTEVYYDSVFATFAIARENNEALVETLTLRYQGCEEDGICFNPIERVFEISLPAGEGTDIASAAISDAPISEQAKLAALISNGNLLLVLGTFFLAGLVLSMTPCVLPMVPILSGIIAGDGDNVTPMRGFWLALLYVLGMALTYTIAGAAFAAAGQQAQTIFQQPWILATFAGLFVILAMSMFGFFNLQMPSSIQTRLASISGNQKSGTAVGAFVMGALSSLVVTACVAPPLVAALAVIGQSGDVVRGGLALFALSMGMGMPLLVVGASAGRLMPKVGPWMETVKQGFGFVMLGLAIWMLARLLPGGIILLLWAVLIFIAGVYLGGLTPLSEQPTGGRKLGKGFGMLAMLYGAVLFVGALAGGHDPLQPLKGSLLEARAVAVGGEATHAELQFERVKTVADLEQAIATADANGQAVMLDFYADWCVSCKEMEKYTFTDAAVMTALSNTVLLQADVTDNDDADQALLKRFGIFGPPSIIFFGPDGVERPGYQVVGYMKAEKFAPHAIAATAAAATSARR
ncbi:MAG: protein-disulfide reductase DsbD [Woeseiaceae bacterium]